MPAWNCPIRSRICVHLIRTNLEATYTNIEAARMNPGAIRTVLSGHRMPPASI